MTTLVTVEFVSAVFLGILLITQTGERIRSESSRRLNICIILVLLTLAVDAMAYLFIDDSTPFVFRYLVCLFAYLGEGICFLGFAYYSEAFFAEKTELNPWIFRILKIAEVIWIAATAAAFFAGKMVVYENGVEVGDNGYPIYLSVYQIAVMLYTPAVALRFRKELGSEAVILLSFFNIAPIIGILAAIIAYYDYSYVLGAVALVFIVEFPQRKQLQEQEAELTAHEVLKGNYDRILALEDNFEVLYDVDLETGRYDIFVKGQTFGDVNSNLINDNSFFDDVEKNLDVVYPEDRQGNYDTTRPEYIRRALSEDDHFDRYYRLMVDGKPTWARMRIVYKDRDKKSVIIGVFNAEEEIAAREKEERQHRETELRLQHEQLRAEVISRMIDYDDDPIEVLKGYAERLRVLIDCDQVIYRDLEETRIMVNSPAIEKTWSVPVEYCRQCQHFDAHHPMYAGGYTEMDNCQEGWQGIPVYRDCPIKSSLTRIVYVDGETAGYLAIHYVQNYHQFTDLERKTVEEFTRILSISLSRYTARLESRDKKRYDILHEIIHSGKWSFTVSADDEVLSADYSQEVMRVIDNDFSEGADDWVQLLHPDDREAAVAAFNATIADHTCSTPYDVTYRMADRNGEYHWFHSAGRIIRDQDGKGEFFGIHINITDQIEEQLEHQRQLQTARDAADAANRSKSNFLFSMSHDIRTPMNAIRGFTTMAKKHADDREKVIDYLDKIDISGQQLLKLINQVLEMARIESGRTVLEEKPVNIREEFNSMVTVLSEQAKVNGLTFIHSVSGIEHVNVLADEAKMSSITLNIVGNAMKYTPEGGTIEYSVREIPARKPGYATFVCTVKDTGIGMSAEYLRELYEPFSREKNSTVSRIQGTGLGMSIVKKTVDLMGGDIEVRSEPGKGTEFDITVDFRIDENTAPADEAAEDIGEVSFEGRRVLLVEDNEMNREIARDILEEQGLVVEDADDGDTAVEMVQKAADRGDYGFYDFILMDIQMPRMNGYDATRAIRAIQGAERIHIPIIAMTANAFDEDRQNALAAGMDEHLSKPIDVPKLFRTIARFL